MHNKPTTGQERTHQHGAPFLFVCTSEREKENPTTTPKTHKDKAGKRIKKDNQSKAGQKDKKQEQRDKTKGKRRKAKGEKQGQTRNKS